MGLCRSLSVSTALMLTVSCALFATMLLSASAYAQSRVALVIGNGAYRQVSALANPTNDANDVADSLQRLGFSVTRVANATFEGMRLALRDFGPKVRAAEMAVIFFAGHGLEVGGENYLIPIDADLKTDLDVPHEAISLKNVMQVVSPASKFGLVVLDACRNNPFASRMVRTLRTRAVGRGLASVEPTGSILVAYAAKDGTTASDGTGRNSPFTKALLTHLETPGLEVNFLFRNVRDDVLRATQLEQEPFVYGSLSREAIFFKAAPPPVPLPAPDEVMWNFLKDTADVNALKRFIDQFPASTFRPEAVQRLARLTAEAAKAAPPAPDEVMWSFLRDTADVNALKRFIEQFPASTYRPEAVQRLARLTAEAAKAAPPEPNRTELARSLQLELKRIGCFEGAIDGEFSDGTRAAFRNFVKLAALSLPTEDVTPDAVRAVRAFNKRVCPLNCPTGESAEGDRCVKIVCPAGQVLKEGACVSNRPSAKASAPTPKGGTKCFTFQGRQFCE